MVDEGQVIGVLQRAERPVKARDIARALKLGNREYSDLRRLLRRLERSGRVYRGRGRRYSLPRRINLVVGRLEVTRAGHGFVVPDETKGDVFIPGSQLGDAQAGDRVVVRVEKQRRGRNPEGSVVRVLERARTQVVGVYRRRGRYAILVPEEGTLRRDVFVAAESEGGARDGDVVVARIVDWGGGTHDPVGEVTEVLGRPGDPGVDVLAIVHAHELRREFPGAVTRVARQQARRGIRSSDLEAREDYRDLPVFTIDPVDAKDHDDAVSIRRVDSDAWSVGVHIADVSHYVPPGSEIDEEALERATSVYLVDRVLPMLPEELSADLCSLRPGADRLTVSAWLELDATAAVKSVRFAGGIIRSQQALAYEEAQEIIDGKGRHGEERRSSLVALRDLALQLRRRRLARGGLDFDLPEARVIVNAAGEPTQIQRLLRLESHQLIEEFMILVNQSVARLAESRALPFLYRIHEPPDPDRLERLREFLSGLGLKLPRDAERSPRALQRLLERVDGRPEEAVVSTLVLRSMKQARYSAKLEGHFGLGLRAYSHFTSPIRRYPDLVAHRVLGSAVLGRGTLDPTLADRLGFVAERSSQREREAMEAERDSVELKKMEFMERHVGDEFEGTVSGVKSFGFFVMVDDVLVEGLVHVSELEDDYYRFVEEEYSLVGEGRRRRFRLGDRVRVQVVRVDRGARKLDLRFAGAPS